MARIAASLGRVRVAQEAASVAAGQGATILARLVGLRLLTGAIRPEVFGEVNLLLGLATLGMSACCTPVLQALLRYFPDASKDRKLGDLKRVSSRLLYRSTLALVLLVGVGGGAWRALSGSGPSLPSLFLLGVIIVVDVQRQYWTSFLNAARRQTSYSFWLAADAWVRPLAAVAFVTLVAPSTSIVLLGFAAGGFLVNAGFHRVIRSSAGEEEIDRRWAEQLQHDVYRFIAPLVPVMILSGILQLSDRYILAGVSGKAVAGLYIAAYGLASQPFIAVANVGVSVFRPILFEAVAREDLSKERRIVGAWLLLLATVYGAGWGLLWMGSGFISRFFLAKEYFGAASLLPWIGAAYAFQGFQYVFETMIYAQRKTARFLPLNILGAGVALLFYFLLIPPLGALGAAVASCAALAVTCLASLLLAQAPGRLFGQVDRAPSAALGDR